MYITRGLLRVFAGAAVFPLVACGQPESISPASRVVPQSQTRIVFSRSDVVDLAQAYLDTLSDSQRASTVLAYTATNAAKWSNLPSTPNSNGTNNLRNGVSYSTLTDAQKVAWRRVVLKALGSAGYSEFSDIRASDDYLGLFSNGYDGDYVYLAFVGTPSETDNWLLQVGGHHVAWNILFQGNESQSTTPHFLGVEPAIFTDTDGIDYEPLKDQLDTMYAMINSLDSTQLSSARLSQTFSDVYLGPGSDDRDNFPTGTTGRGILGSELTSDQQELVKAAMLAWVEASPNAAEYQTLYESELDNTYIAYSGSTGLDSQSDYVRIDGPHVWIEFVCQNGVVFREIHYHTIWRDRVTDYNAEFGF